MYDISASIVTFQTDPGTLLDAVNSFLNTDLKVKLFISDNSPDDSLKKIFNDERVEYIFNNKNLGFGMAHNICIKKAENTSSYHLILNPDVYFNSGVLEELKQYMDQNPDIGLISPKVLYPDGSIQYSCRLLPQPFDFWIRQVGFLRKIFIKRVRTQELQFTGYDKIMEVPFILGCFMLIRTGVFSKIGMFDNRFFMYLEDLDLTRRIHAKYKTIFYPHVNIYHVYAKESRRNMKLLKIHLESLVGYFNKWGWFSSKEISRVNKEILSKLSILEKNNR